MMSKNTIQAICEEAIHNPNVYLVSADLLNVAEEQYKIFGDRFQNAGMAEQNIIGVAAGISRCEKKAFAHGMAAFITLRCIEQIKVDICAYDADVTVIGRGAGFTYGKSGITHFALEDIAMMRSLPNVKIISPSGPAEGYFLMQEIIKLGGPAYIRLDKDKDNDLVDKMPKFGKGMIIREGKDITIFCTGTILAEALLAVDILLQKGISAELINIHTIKPLDTDLIKERATTRPLLYTLEEHNIIGGLGGAIAEVLSEFSNKAVLKRFGTNDMWPHVTGSQKYLRELTGLSGEKLAKRIEQDLLRA